MSTDAPESAPKQHSARATARPPSLQSWALTTRPSDIADVRARYIARLRSGLMRGISPPMPPEHSSRNMNASSLAPSS